MSAAMALIRRKRRSTNRHPGRCCRCNVKIDSAEGVILRAPLRLVCQACYLREGVKDDNGLEVRLREPIVFEGKELTLMPFQEEDCRRIATTRALLNGNQMGCGKTIETTVAALRADRPNLVFTPASVRENWVDEIEKWRPDLMARAITSQAQFAEGIDEHLRSPGHVLVCSYGVLPGAPCSGCRALKTRLRQLKKWKEEVCTKCDLDDKGKIRKQRTIKSEGVCLGCGKNTTMLERPRYLGSWYPTCDHFPDENNEPREHPPHIDLRIDGTFLRLPYHPKGMDCDQWVSLGVKLPTKGPIPSAEAVPAEGVKCFGCKQVNPLPRITRSVVLVADECHAFKNPNNQRTRLWRSLREAVWDAGGFVHGLSGTPCEGKPQEFWDVLVSLGLAKAAFDSYEKYKKIFAHWFENDKGKRLPPVGQLRDELHDRLRRVQLNRRRKDVLKQLPPRREIVIPVDINEKTIHEVNEAVHRMLAVTRAYEDVKQGALHNSQRMEDPFDPQASSEERERRRMIYDDRVEYYFRERPWILDDEISSAVDSALTSKRRMPSIDELSRIRSMLSKAKVAAVKQWIEDREEEDEPIVLFSQHVSILKKIAGDSLGSGRPGWACFHGGLSGKKRQELVKGFQSGKIERGLAVSIMAGGEGITLTRASVCGFIDLSFNPAKNHQSEARLIRIGAEQHKDKAAQEAWERIVSGDTRECAPGDPCRFEHVKSEATGHMERVAVPCEQHQARITVVRFVAKHVVDQLVMETLKEKEALLEALEWDEDDEQGAW